MPQGVIDNEATREKKEELLFTLRFILNRIL